MKTEREIELEKALKLAIKYLVKAVHDNELQNTVLPVEHALKLCRKVLDKGDDNITQVA